MVSAMPLCLQRTAAAQDAFGIVPDLLDHSNTDHMVCPCDTGTDIQCAKDSVLRAVKVALSQRRELHAPGGSTSVPVSS